MTLLTIVFVLIATSVHGIFLIKREILFDNKHFRTLLKISIGLFSLNYLLRTFDIKTRNMEMMQIPFIALLIFFSIKFIYNKIYDENPEDTYMSGDFSLIRDGIFNALFWMIGLIGPIILVTKVF
jgi:hypothetical protein